MKLIEKSIIIDFSQQIRLSIFIDFRYNQLILSIVIACYRLLTLSIAQVGFKVTSAISHIAPYKIVSCVIKTGNRLFSLNAYASQSTQVQPRYAPDN